MALNSESLLGGSLDGEKIVRIVYLDEAGISNPDQEPFVVVAGVIVDADKKLLGVERHLDSLVEHFIPEEQRDNFVFHAKDLFNGGGKVFKRDDPRWSLEKRLIVADSLARIPRKFGLPIVAGFVRRKGFPSSVDAASSMSERERTMGAHLVAFINAVMQVELWMRQNTQNEVCMIVAEDNSDMRMTIAQTQRVYKSDNSLAKSFPDGLTEKEKAIFPLRKIKHVPLFEPKEPSSVLQLADFCAYVVKNALREKPLYRGCFEAMRPYLAARDISIPWQLQSS